MRIRLKGKWIQGSTPEGNIEQELVYVKIPYGHEEKEEDLTKVPIHHQKLIQMMYIPAMRDPAKQLKMLPELYYGAYLMVLTGQRI